LQTIGRQEQQNWGRGAAVDQQRQLWADRARMADLHTGLVTRLGEQGAAQWEAGRETGTSMQNLRRFLEMGGTLEGGSLTEQEQERLRRGEMREDEIEASVLGSITQRASVAVQGGHNQAVGAPPEQTIAGQMADVLTANALREQQILQASFGRFDAAVSKFSSATETLQNAASRFSGDQTGRTLRGAQDSAASTAKTNSLSAD
jgi:hypothetical protein